MLSTLLTATQTNPYLLSNHKNDSKKSSALVNVHYQENNYQALLEHIQTGQDHGWILFLAPPGKPNTQFFQNAGIDKSRVLMIDSNKVRDNLSLLSTLLKSNNYCTVVTWVNELTETTRLTIEADAKSTNTSCFIYCKQ
ncbi:SulA-like leucine-rich domain-containing protein [Psychromonas sp. L1A2]|uniref:SulA-like leucine-rich domain-containing protein n=1 Tax=Psychromonas sp. L1A2 TaxID=2686356 RepID=UPI00135B28F7|nr:SulA-like leucine-rich domain-containing protein [Psychromonas sp. L1A2]